MKTWFVVLGAIGFVVISFMILVGLSTLPKNCYLDILECTEYGGVLFLGCLWILSLASFIGGLANSEVD